MRLLEERIRKDGIVKGNDVLKVDRFLNHQMDVELFTEIGEEFRRLYAGAKLVGAGICVEKAFQPGGQRIRDMGIRVESLARIKSMSEEDGIEFI